MLGTVLPTGPLPPLGAAAAGAAAVVGLVAPPTAGDDVTLDFAGTLLPAVAGLEGDEVLFAVLGAVLGDEADFGTAVTAGGRWPPVAVGMAGLAGPGTMSGQALRFFNGSLSPQINLRLLTALGLLVEAIRFGLVVVGGAEGDCKITCLVNKPQIKKKKKKKRRSSVATHLFISLFERLKFRDDKRDGVGRQLLTKFGLYVLRETIFLKVTRK